MSNFSVFSVTCIASAAGCSGSESTCIMFVPSSPALNCDTSPGVVGTLRPVPLCTPFLFPRGPCKGSHCRTDLICSAVRLPGVQFLDNSPLLSVTEACLHFLRVQGVFGWCHLAAFGSVCGTLPHRAMVTSPRPTVPVLSTPWSLSANVEYRDTPEACRQAPTGHRRKCLNKAVPHLKRLSRV